MRGKWFGSLTLPGSDGKYQVLAAEIIGLRLNVLKKINLIAGDIYKEITNQKEELVVNYELKTNSSAVVGIQENSVESWREWYLLRLKERQTIDVLRGSTGIGPHRDDLFITVNENNLRAFGSQGQQRSGALALKLAEMEYVKVKLVKYPVCCSDDVMSELDSERRTQILNFIDGGFRLLLLLTIRILYLNWHATDIFASRKVLSAG